MHGRVSTRELAGEHRTGWSGTYVPGPHAHELLRNPAAPILQHISNQRCSLAACDAAPSHRS